MGIIKHRLVERGGGEKEFFTSNALESIHQNTQGYPRKINKLCHQLLLSMITEKSDQINQNMVLEIIGGGKPSNVTKNKSKSKSATEEKVEEKEEKKDVAVNKLFDILRSGGKKETSGKIGEEVKDEDVIGDLYGAQDDEDDEDDELEEEIIEEIEKEKKWFQFSNKKPKKSIGFYPPNIRTNPMKRENHIVGLSMDQGHIFIVIVQDKAGIKTLIDCDIYRASKSKLDPKRNPTGFSVAIGKAYQQLLDKIEKKKKISNSLVKKIKNSPPVGFTINIIGVANADYLKAPSKVLLEKKWDIRLWAPVAQTILNSFLWNYPNKKHDIILILHIGEIESLLIGYNQGYPDSIMQLDLGIQNLTDAWKYRSTTAKSKWFKRDYCRVPPSILKSNDKDS